MHPMTLCVIFKSGTRSVLGGIPLLRVGTISGGGYACGSMLSSARFTASSASMMTC
jgi:hypothetical protein